MLRRCVIGQVVPRRFQESNYIHSTVKRHGTNQTGYKHLSPRDIRHHPLPFTLGKVRNYSPIDTSERSIQQATPSSNLADNDLIDAPACLRVLRKFPLSEIKRGIRKCKHNSPGSDRIHTRLRGYGDYQLRQTRNGIVVNNGGYCTSHIQ